MEQTGLRRPVSHVGPDQYQFTLKRPDRFSVPLRRVCEKLQEQRGGGRRDEAQERGLLSGEEMEGVPSSTAGSWRFQLPTQEVSARRERETVSSRVCARASSFPENEAQTKHANTHSPVCFAADLLLSGSQSTS